MRAIINGIEGGKLGLFKGGDASLKCHLINDDGSPLDTTGAGSITFSFFDTKDRRNAATFSKAGTNATPLAGYSVLTLLAAEMTFGPGTNGVPYYLFVKLVDTDAAESVGLVPVEVYIK